MNPDIQIALDTIKANAPKRQRYIDYYDGNHELGFATEKFKSAFGRTLKGMRDNLCPIVVDAPADRMEVINFAGQGEEPNTGVAGKAWELWQREQMELVSNETHKEAFKCGCGYVIVWPDVENKAKFYLQDSRNVCLIEDEDSATPLFAAKQWTVDVSTGNKVEKFVRLTLYYADKIEKYITSKAWKEGIELKARHFISVTRQTEDGTVIEEGSTPNPYGLIPVFKFEASPVLNDAIPLQDSLNKTFADRMVSQEYASFRQRWATGLEPPTDELTGAQKKLFDGGADRLWFTNDPAVKFGDFEATMLEPFIKAADSDRLEMARVTGTPLHFFSINTSDAISGKALKALESRFTKKVGRLCLNFGAVWAQVMSFALLIENASGEGSITTQWAPVETQDDDEMCDTLLKKQKLGVDDETIWEEMGYPKEQIAKFQKAKEAKKKEEAAQMQAQGVAA